MSRVQVVLLLAVFLSELPPLELLVPHRNVIMDRIKAEREKRETPEEAKRPWDGLYLTGPRAFEKREPSTEGRAPASK